MSTETQARAAIQRWAQALNTPHDVEALRAAAAPEITVKRHGRHDMINSVVQVFEGYEQIAAWFGRTPAPARFALVGPLQGEPGERYWRARYEIRIDDFKNRGWWRFELADDGRLLTIWHRADDITPPPDSPSE